MPKRNTSAELALALIAARAKKLIQSQLDIRIRQVRYVAESGVVISWHRFDPISGANLKVRKQRALFLLQVPMD